MWKWTRKREDAAIALAEGRTQKDVSTIVGVHENTITNWLKKPEFSEEVDRLSFMVGIANRANRLRLANRVIRQCGDYTEKDLLDWLKFVQSETDGAKLDLTEFFKQLTQHSAVNEDDS